MQVKKDSVRQQILQSAKKEFIKNGYLKANLRAIARGASCSLSNLYNYFPSKNELFLEVLKPVTEVLDTFFKAISEIKLPEDQLMREYEWEMNNVAFIIEYIDNNRELLSLLALKSDGSTVSSFIDQIIESYMAGWNNYFQILQQRANIRISPFFIRNICLFHINSITEALKINLSKDEMKQYAKEIMTFTYFGFKSLLENNPNTSSIRINT